MVYIKKVFYVFLSLYGLLAVAQEERYRNYDFVDCVGVGESLKDDETLIPSEFLGEDVFTVVHVKDTILYVDYSVYRLNHIRESKWSLYLNPNFHPPYYKVDTSVNIEIDFSTMKMTTFMDSDENGLKYKCREDYFNEEWLMEIMVTYNEQGDTLLIRKRTYDYIDEDNKILNVYDEDWVPHLKQDFTLKNNFFYKSNCQLNNLWIKEIKEYSCKRKIISKYHSLFSYTVLDFPLGVYDVYLKGIYFGRRGENYLTVLEQKSNLKVAYSLSLEYYEGERQDILSMLWINVPYIK